MIQTLTNHYPFIETSNQPQAKPLTSNFAEVYTSVQAPNQNDLTKAAKMLEAHLVTQAFKAMDEGETPLLGTSMQGLSYFSDLFFQTLAEEVVRQKGLGFDEVVARAYGVSAPQPDTSLKLVDTRPDNP
ncbi:MAG: hypothetical protein H6510_00295 [Acidobacteria bacterium]|nr:hypothetical protein [Acidobacteriota bacterium]MCB9396227.1 hypothetical protein [Acidobacteriota bacterium]